MKNKNIAKKVNKSILIIRNQKVILSSDLAKLYEVHPKVLIQAVKRNIDRFPEDFIFQLSELEYSNLKSQIVTSSWGGVRSNPYAFTEQGVAMLSSILRSPRAVKVNIEIMRTFVKLRQLLQTNYELSMKLDKLEEKYDGHFKIVFEAIRELMNPPTEAKRKQIGFKK